MISIFKDSFGLPENRYIRTGIPRTDFFYDEIRKSKAIDRLQSDFPKINGKKVIMYAPTYRDGEFNSVNLQIDLEQMYEHFKHDYVLFLRLHPTVNSKFRNKYPDFIYNVSNYFSDRKSTRLNSSHVAISYAVFRLKKKTPQYSRQLLLWTS